MNIFNYHRNIIRYKGREYPFREVWLDDHYINNTGSVALTKPVLLILLTKLLLVEIFVESLD